MTVCTIPIEAQPVAEDSASAHARVRARQEHHARIWRQRPLTREIYSRYFDLIDSTRSQVAGASLELGAGPGHYSKSRPDTFGCDLVPCPWLDCAADAGRLPVADAALANLIMIDVLHHLPDPTAFFAEAQRTLAPGGRIILVEPYVSPVSWFVWNFLHEEDVGLSVNPFAGQVAAEHDSEKDPWDANVALPTLIFWKGLAEFHTRFPNLRVVQRRRFEMVLMPLSGGFEHPRLMPAPLVPLARALDYVFTPLARLLAFRCFVVIEKVD